MASEDDTILPPIGPKKMPPCGNPECCVSTGIHEGLTFGSGELDFNGYWEHPCGICARGNEKKHPEDGPCWPFEWTWPEGYPECKGCQMVFGEDEIVDGLCEKCRKGNHGQADHEKTG